MTQADKLIRMANQIAVFCASNPDGARHTANVADHINKYWDPRMRTQLLSIAPSAANVHPLVRSALPSIRVPVVPLSDRASHE